MTEKLSRNDPCSCGSGKKYKKCCGVQEKLSQQSTSVINVNGIIAEGEMGAPSSGESNSLAGAKNKLQERQQIKVVKAPAKGPQTTTKPSYRTKSGRGK